ncbi:zinc-finger homeodomain protein 1-like [Neltuma alba]|uniref:zinc-finger homeodomain protein 1-like n=1 Tax=Neltuma alba TaxID=207710 RepID=UPI0010A2E8C1|nr:zinc-finger homeodomain protein 1-like [Prosopis alba]XP_028805511.1 zinc-finger homeodomain protein 1-like [Prosopis alba]
MEGEGDHSHSSNSIYRECLRNHAASLGSYATDGCGEFTLDDTSPGGCLQCAACGCHRNFHRKVTFPPPPRGFSRPELTGELMEYSGGEATPPSSGMMEAGERTTSGTGNKKRFRTKFTAEQKEKMMGFAEKLGWKLQRKDLDDEIERFCRGVGVSRQVFKVWMHNHKNSSSSSSANSTGNASSLTQ